MRAKQGDLSGSGERKARREAQLTGEPSGRRAAREGFHEGEGERSRWSAAEASPRGGRIGHSDGSPLKLAASCSGPWHLSEPFKAQRKCEQVGPWDQLFKWNGNNSDFLGRAPGAWGNRCPKTPEGPKGHGVFLKISALESQRFVRDSMRRASTGSSAFGPMWPKTLPRSDG